MKLMCELKFVIYFCLKVALTQNNYIYEKERECIKMDEAIIVKDLFVSYQGIK